VRFSYRAVVQFGIKGEFDKVERGIIEPEQAFYGYVIVDDETGETMFEKTKMLLPPPRATQP
jgi:hypothetical protein